MCAEKFNPLLLLENGSLPVPLPQAKLELCPLLTPVTPSMIGNETVLIC